MRKLLIFTFVGLFLLFTLPLLLVIFLIGLFHTPSRNRLAFAILRWFTRAVLFMAGATCDVQGTENIPKDGSLLFVGNHRSLVDIVLVMAFLPRAAGFIAKNSLAKIPLLNWWMLAFECLFLDRENARNALTTILKGIENMKKGSSYVIFPEGTRNMEENTLLPFKKGSLKLAEKSGSLIVPFGLRGTDELFERNNYKIKPTKLSLYFGEAVDLQTLSAEDSKISNEIIQAKVMQLYMASQPM